MKESELQQPLPPPVPPPFPPACWSESGTEIKALASGQEKVLGMEKNELEMAVQRLLSLERNLKDVFYLRNIFLVPQLQDGPKCGLVALSIATSMTKNFVNVKDIFELALVHGFTKQGEIFDASALACLAEKLGFKAKILDRGLKSHLSCILNNLLNRSLLLVPYDADFNHAPCCKEGSRAHWAVISGFVIMKEKSENDENSDVVAINSGKCTDCETTPSVDQQLYFFSHEGKTVIAKKRKSNCETSNNGKVYLVGLQGKSRHVALWSFEDMDSSNDNLIYFPPTRNPEMYIVPEGGVARGLKGRSILLEC